MLQCSNQLKKILFAGIHPEIKLALEEGRIYSGTALQESLMF